MLLAKTYDFLLEMGTPVSVPYYAMTLKDGNKFTYDGKVVTVFIYSYTTHKVSEIVQFMDIVFIYTINSNEVGWF